MRRIARLSMLGAGVALACLAAPAAAGPVPAPPPGAAAQDAFGFDDDYAYIDRADVLWSAIGDAPPDFAFAFEGAEPWAWQTSDGYVIVVEDAGAEGIRSYYFAPGDGAPFLVVEPGRSFGYDGGEVATVYGPDGGVLPDARRGDYRDEAMDLFARGIRLKQALQGEPQEVVDAGAWIDASPYIFGFLEIWDLGRSRYPAWNAYRTRAYGRVWLRQLDNERRRRWAIADSFRRWHQGGFQGRPPGHWHKPGAGAAPGRPHRPQPGAGGPPRPRPPGATRPGQPGAGGPGRPGYRPGGPGQRPPAWRRPDAQQPGAGPSRPGQPDRPRRPWPGRPDAAAPSAPAPSAAPAGTPAPAETRPAPRPPRPEGGWQGPRRPRPVPGTATPSGGTATPAPAPSPTPAARPQRPEGGWQGQRPPRPRPTPTPSVTPAPTAQPMNWNARPAPAVAPQRSYAPPPRSYTPPAASPSPQPSQPATRPAPSGGSGWRNRRRD